MNLEKTTLTRNGLASVTMDYIRFLAALAVVFGHGVSRVFGPYNEVVNPTIFEKLFRVIFSGYGSPAVMVFFVLSGLFIGQSVICQVDKGRFSFLNYLARRLVRLWIVLIPALFLTYFFDWFGLNYFSSDGFYISGQIFGAVNPSNLSFQIFLSNLFFIQTIVSPPLGSNGALWSLSNEFWYYVIFPILFIGLFSKLNVLYKSISLFIVCFLFFFIGLSISSLFLIWLLGVLLLYLPNRFVNERNYKKMLFWGFVNFIGVFVFIRVSDQFESKFLERLLCGLSFFTFCYLLMSSDKLFKPSTPSIALSSKLSGFSYTLYLIHTPLLGFFRGLLINEDAYLKFNFGNVLLFFFIVALILVFSYLLARVTEFNTKAVYNFLKI